MENVANLKSSQQKGGKKILLNSNRDYRVNSFYPQQTSNLLDIPFSQTEIQNRKDKIKQLLKVQEQREHQDKVEAKYLSGNFKEALFKINQEKKTLPDVNYAKFIHSRNNSRLSQTSNSVRTKDQKTVKSVVSQQRQRIIYKSINLEEGQNKRNITVYLNLPGGFRQKVYMQIPNYKGNETIKELNMDLKQFYEECNLKFRVHKINNIFLQDGTPIHNLYQLKNDCHEIYVSQKPMMNKTDDYFESLSGFNKYSSQAYRQQASQETKSYLKELFKREQLIEKDSKYNERLQKYGRNLLKDESFFKDLSSTTNLKIKDLLKNNMYFDGVNSIQEIVLKDYNQQQKTRSERDTQKALNELNKVKYTKKEGSEEQELQNQSYMFVNKKEITKNAYTFGMNYTRQFDKTISPLKTEEDQDNQFQNSSDSIQNVQSFRIQNNLEKEFNKLINNSQQSNLDTQRIRPQQKIEKTVQQEIRPETEQTQQSEIQIQHSTENYKLNLNEKYHSIKQNKNSSSKSSESLQSIDTSQVSQSNNESEKNDIVQHLEFPKKITNLRLKDSQSLLQAAGGISPQKRSMSRKLSQMYSNQMDLFRDMQNKQQELRKERQQSKLDPNKELDEENLVTSQEKQQYASELDLILSSKKRQESQIERKKSKDRILAHSSINLANKTSYKNEFSEMDQNQAKYLSQTFVHINEDSKVQKDDQIQTKIVPQYQSTGKVRFYSNQRGSKQSLIPTQLFDPNQSVNQSISSKHQSIDQYAEMLNKNLSKQEIREYFTKFPSFQRQRIVISSRAQRAQKQKSKDFIQQNIRKYFKDQKQKEIDRAYGDLITHNIPKMQLTCSFNRQQLYQIYTKFKSLCKISQSEYPHMLGIGVYRDVFMRGLKELSLDNTDLLEKIFDSVDGGQKLFLNWDEFFQAMKLISTQDLKDKIDLFFKIVDKDRNGSFSYDEIKEICKLSMSKIECVEEKQDDQNVIFYANYIFKILGRNKNEEIPTDDFKDKIFNGDPDTRRILAMFCCADVD